MIQKYVFSGEGTIEFEDTKTVRELIEYAFAVFGYEEPLGMDIVTVFQAYHPDTDCGWFTTDTSLTCAREIRTPDQLCFAYHMPKVFYFAEGGWGHHMTQLGNHPEIPNGVCLKLRFEDFKNTVVINGQYTMQQVVKTLKEAEYIDSGCSFVEVIPIGCASKSYRISLADPIMEKTLTEFLPYIEKYTEERIRLSPGEYIYHIALQLC